MNRWIKTTAAAAALVAAAHAGAQITFYEREDFRGSAFSTAQQIDNFARPGFNDRASSVVVEREDWQICQDAGFRGQCVVLRPGRYPSLQALGLNIIQCADGILQAGYLILDFQTQALGFGAIDFLCTQQGHLRVDCPQG